MEEPEHSLKCGRGMEFKALIFTCRAVWAWRGRKSLSTIQETQELRRQPDEIWDHHSLGSFTLIFIQHKARRIAMVGCVPIEPPSFYSKMMQDLVAAIWFGGSIDS
ncbi:uncharacterized protein LOC129285210 [Prosopis cineraria]|uniref:uncharacterized protein LOC129285210 n=1 Tax=Prosopis cineraria TaxID=364024 RepID=UPI00241065C2|nr:uncharacterized protein LOC129285210 [Prosopis cineraria]